MFSLYPHNTPPPRSRPFFGIRWARIFLISLLFLGGLGCDGTTPNPDGGSGDCGGVCKANEECVQGQFCLAKCEASETRCGAKCYNIQTETTHCGKCDNTCKSGESCVGGACKTSSCSAEETDCSGTCVNVKTDKSHCGTCGTSCKDGESCQEGVCKTGSACAAEETDCSGTCVNVKTNKNHCGACGNACGTDLSCKEGVCACQGSATDCNGTCVDLQSSDANCGACGNACSSPQYCDVGKCVCPTGQTACGVGCVDLKSDAIHCGACDNACLVGQSCFEGACKSRCPAGQEECGTVCVDPQTDAQNCGSCGTTCQSGETCQNGGCQKACSNNETSCSGTCTNTQTDAQNCGACGTTCTSGQVCENGACKLGCPTGQSDCNGSCVNLVNDKGNCGACGTTCSTGEFCSQGICNSNCGASETECSGVCTNTQNDSQNCGACAKACASGEVCASGACSASCGSGETNCSGACVNTQNDNAHCGACGNFCAGGKECNSGACACPSGKTDCNGVCVNTQEDTQNCGTCGTTCNSSQICKAATCQAPCSIAGQVQCSGTCVDTSNNKDHCGSCGTACSSGQVCTNGTCKVSCSAGETPCNGVCVDLKSNQSNCGTCGTTCRSDQTCGNGTCACPNGKTECSGACAELQSNRNHCGACGTTCSNNQVCVAGACQGIWTSVLSGDSSTKIDAITANNKGNIYVTGVAPRNDSLPNLLLKKIDNVGTASDFSVQGSAPVSFHADLSSDKSMTGTSWNILQGWRASAVSGLHNPKNYFNTSTGVYTAPHTGYYLFNARVRFDDANGSGNSIEAVFVVDGQVITSNGTMVRAALPLRLQSLVLEGILPLTAGQKVTLQVRSTNDAAYSIKSDSGFSGIYLGPNLSHGFQARLAAEKPYTNTNWNQVSGFQTSGDTILFSNGGGFDASTGEYTAPLDGIYYISARPCFLDAVGRVLGRPPLPSTYLPLADIEAILAINGSTTNNEGRYAKIGRQHFGRYSLNLGGFVRLKKGDKVSLRIRSEDNNYKIALETGFSGFFVGELQAETFQANSGFSTTLSQSQAVTTTGWTQIKNLGAATTGSLFKTSLANTNDLNHTNAEYTAPVNGYYVFNTNVILKNINSNGYIRIGFGVGGSKDISRGSNVVENLSYGPEYSMYLNSILYLSAGQKVSLWVYSSTKSSYSIEAGTQFSGYLISQPSTSLQGHAIATDTNDNVYIAGAVQGNLSLVHSNVIGSNRTFLAKRNTNGTWAWQKILSNESPSSLLVDSTGNIYLCGNFYDNWLYDTGKNLTGTKKDGYVAKFNSSGVLQWVNGLTSPGDTTQNPKCALSNSNELFVMGTFTDKITIGAITLNQSQASGTFRYIARINATGTGAVWAKSFNTAVALTGIAANQNGTGEVYVVGTFDKTLSFDSTNASSTNKELFVMALTKTGSVQWVQQTKLVSNSVRSGSIDFYNDQIYVTADINGRTEFGTTSVGTSGGYDLVLANLNKNGAWLWARSVIGTLDDFSPNLAFDGAGNFYFSGSFKSPTLTFGPLVSSKKSSGTVNYDSVVAKNLP